MLSPVEIDILIRLVVARAKVDKTEPDSSNLRKGWRTDELLGDIDTFMVSENDMVAYSEIGRKIYQRVKDLPEMAVLAGLVILRAQRLLPLTSGQIQLIHIISEDLKVTISALSEGARKKRCQELFLYNMGIFYDATGRFDEAAKTQEWAAREAGEGSSSATISRYCAAFSRLKQALFVGKISDELDALFFDLEVKKSVQLAEALYGSELYVQWVEGNYPVHMIMVCVWLNWPHSRWNQWVATALTAAGKLGKGWEIGIEFVRAAVMNACGNNDREAKKALIVIAENGVASNETRATALLMLARNSASLEERRGFVEKMPVEGAQHVRAIAERMLK